MKAKPLDPMRTRIALLLFRVLWIMLLVIGVVFLVSGILRGSVQEWGWGMLLLVGSLTWLFWPSNEQTPP